MIVLMHFSLDINRPNDFPLQKLLFSVSELLNSASGTIFFQFTGFGFNEFFFLITVLIYMIKNDVLMEY